MRILRVAMALAGCALLSAGCARSVVVTEVKPDGSWSRTDTFVGAPTEKKPAGGLSLGSTPQIREAFLLPEGPAWQTKIDRKPDEVTFTATRNLAKGDSLKDDVIVRAKGVPRQIDNEVTIREVSPGRLEYREVLHWRGEKMKELLEGEPEIARQIKALAPPGVMTDEDSKAVTSGIIRELWTAIFGPGESLLSGLMMHPDMIERKMKLRFGRAISRVLAERMGDRLTFEQRAAMVRKVTESTLDEKSPFGKQKASLKDGMGGLGALGGGPGDNMNMVAMGFVVKMPGRIVATNGDADEFSGEVHWVFYSPAVAIGDLTLTATCEVGK